MSMPQAPDHKNVFELDKLYGLINELLESKLKDVVAGNSSSSSLQKLTTYEKEDLAEVIRLEMEQLFGLGIIASIEGHIKQDILQRIETNNLNQKTYEDLEDVIDSALIATKLEEMLKFKFSAILDSIKHKYASASKFKGYVESRNWIAHGKYFEANLPNPSYDYKHLKRAALDFAVDWGIETHSSKFFKV
ncbi:MAG: hypothetical protein ACOCZ8_03625 [Bacteroidota bacterium]